MKTLEEFCKELAESKELQAELKAATDAALEAFLKQHGCEASAEEFFGLAAAREGALDDDEAANAAGGYRTLAETVAAQRDFFAPGGDFDADRWESLHRGWDRVFKKVEKQ